MKKVYVVYWVFPGGRYMPAAVFRNRLRAAQWIEKNTTPMTNSRAYFVHEIDIDI